MGGREVNLVKIVDKITSSHKKRLIGAGFVNDQVTGSDIKRGRDNFLSVMERGSRGVGCGVRERNEYMN